MVIYRIELPPELDEDFLERFRLRMFPRLTEKFLGRYALLTKVGEEGAEDPCTALKIFLKHSELREHKRTIQHLLDIFYKDIDEYVREKKTHIQEKFEFG